MNQRGWSLSSYIGYAVVLLIFILIIAFNVIRLNQSGLVDNDTKNSGATMKGENNFNNYSEAESAVVDSLKAYRADKYKKNDIEGTLVITVKELISGGYLKKTLVSGSSCSGYGIISKSGSTYNYESYIKCGDYTTNGYTSSLDR